MSIFHRKAHLNKDELAELKAKVGVTIESALLSNEEIVYFLRDYDLIFISDWKYELIECAIYQSSTFLFDENGFSTLKNSQLYFEKRELVKRPGITVYFDPEKISDLSKRDLVAFRYLSKLISEFEVEMHSATHYRCTW